MAGSKGVNLWPAFADMVFVMFVSALVAGIGFHTRSQRLELENTNLRLTIEAMRKRMLSCGPAGQFISKLEACMSETGALAGQKSGFGDRCSVTIGEDLVTFETSRARPRSNSEEAARQLARCLWEAELGLYREDRSAFDSIEAIRIDGHTDCTGQDPKNVLLGAQRASWLYESYVGSALEDWRNDVVSEGEVEQLISIVHVRSFGSHHPVADSPCRGRERPLGSAGVEVADDRRVTISVARRLLSGSRDSD